MSIRQIVRGARLGASPYPVAITNTLVEGVRNLPGLVAAVMPSMMTAGQSPIEARDAKGGRRVYATSTRSPALIDGGAAWGGRVVFDGTGVSNLNLNLAWTRAASFSAIMVAEKPAGQHFLLRSADLKLEFFTDGSGIMRWRTDAGSSASQVVWSSGTSAAGPRVMLVSWDAETARGAIHIGDPGAAIVEGPMAINSSTSGSIWIGNSGASTPLLGRFGDVLIFDRALHLSLYQRARADAFAVIKAWYGIA